MASAHHQFVIIRHKDAYDAHTHSTPESELHQSNTRSQPVIVIASRARWGSGKALEEGALKHALKMAADAKRTVDSRAHREL